MNQTTNADVAEDDQNIYRTTGGRVSRPVDHQRGLEPPHDRHLPARRHDGHLGDRPVPRRQQGHALLRRVARRRVVHGGRDAQGQSRLCRAVADRVLLRPHGSTTSGTTPITRSGARYLLDRPLRGLLRPVRHGRAALDDLQLPEAEPLGLRGAADVAGRQQAAVDGGRVLRGRLRLVGVRRRRCRASRPRPPGQRPRRTASRSRRRRTSRPARSRRPTIYYYNKYQQHGQAARLLRRDDL